MEPRDVPTYPKILIMMIDVALQLKPILNDTEINRLSFFCKYSNKTFASLLN